MKWGLGNVMWKSKSDKGFAAFLLKDGIPVKAVIVLILGVLLIVFGGVYGKTPTDARNVSTEEKIADLCSSTVGAGECRVMVVYTDDGEQVYAVAVLCRGADSAEVRGRITEIICTLYGIGANRVSVMKLSE